MKKLTVLYLPADERPCNLQFASRIAKGSPVTVLCPPKSILGNKKKGADFCNIKQFLLQNAAKAQYAVISLDMLLYGGMIPSRLHSLSQQQLCQRLSLVQQLKQANARLKIFAFQLVMRCPNYSSDDEEPSYYAQCGREIFLTGQVKHKMQLGLISQEEATQLLQQYGQKTAPYLADYENRRKVNREMLLQAVKMVGRQIDFLVLPQDDSSPFGYTTMDREAVKQCIRQQKLTDVLMYPGADEVGMTLLARAVCNHFGVTPRVKCVFPHPDCEKIIPLYEDRPVAQTLQSQIAVCGCVQQKGDSADIWLYLNYPTENMVEANQQPSLGYQKRDVTAFCDSLCQNLNKVVALADAAYCNGGDLGLVKEICRRTDFFRLSSYAGWNTSSNTLGTALCQAVFVWLFGKTSWQNKFLAERVYEDVGYCGYARQAVTKTLQEKQNYFNAGGKCGKTAAKVKAVLQQFISENIPEIADRYVLSRCCLPWGRMFEVDLTVRENEKNQVDDLSVAGGGDVSVGSGSDYAK